MMHILSRRPNVCRLRPSVILLIALGGYVAGCGGGGGGAGGDSGAGGSPSEKEPPAVWNATQVVEVAGGGMLTPNVRATMDGDGVSHVVYFDDSGSGELPYRLRHIALDTVRSARHLDREGETVVQVDNSGALAVARGGSGQLVVAYQGGMERECGAEQQSDAMVSVNTNGQWNEYTAAIGEVERNPVFTDGLAGGSMSVATDSQGNIHLSYQFFYEGCDAMNFRYPDLRYVKIDGSAIGTYFPVEETVEGNDYEDDNVQNSVGDHCAIAVDGNDAPVIFYYAVLSDHSKGLRVARRQEGGWRSEWIEEGCEVGAISGAVSVVDGTPAVAYYVTSYDEDTEDGHCLKYAILDGVSWKVHTVDETARCGDHCNLSFDSKNRPGIAYYEMTSHSGYDRKNLKLARLDGLTWNLERVEENGDIGLYNSLSYDSVDNPIIWTFSQTDRSVYMYAKTLGSVQK